MNPIIYSAILTDSFGREVNYAPVGNRSLQSALHLLHGRGYDFSAQQQILSLEELRDTAAAFVDLGVRKIRLTGGEPLIRRDILKLVGSLASLPGLDELTMTSNGVMLPNHGPAIKRRRPVAD